MNPATPPNCELCERAGIVPGQVHHEAVWVFLGPGVQRPLCGRHKIIEEAALTKLRARSDHPMLAGCKFIEWRHYQPVAAK